MVSKFSRYCMYLLSQKLLYCFVFDKIVLFDKLFMNRKYNYVHRNKRKATVKKMKKHGSWVYMTRS